MVDHSFLKGWSLVSWSASAKFLWMLNYYAFCALRAMASDVVEAYWHSGVCPYMVELHRD